MSTFAENRKAFHDYTIIEEMEAGIVLSGQEVKSVREGKISLQGSFIQIRGNSVYLTNAHISPYSKASELSGYDPQRDRKVLLNKKEIDQIADRRQAEGLAIIPLSLYSKKDLIKVKIALARGKRKYDKRETIKKRESDRKIKKAVL